MSTGKLWIIYDNLYSIGLVDRWAYCAVGKAWYNGTIGEFEAL